MTKEITKIRNKRLSNKRKKLFIDLASTQYESSIKGSIKEAIKGKKVIEFYYDGHHRIAEPHVHGISNGQYEILTYQIGGGSKSGGIPDWRRVKAFEIKDLDVTEREFRGRRPFPSGRHSPFDQIFDIVDP